MYKNTLTNKQKKRNRKLRRIAGYGVMAGTLIGIPLLGHHFAKSMGKTAGEVAAKGFDVLLDKPRQFIKYKPVAEQRHTGETLPLSPRHIQILKRQNVYRNEEFSESEGLKKWRRKQKRGKIMKPSTFKRIEAEAKVKGYSNPSVIAGRVYWDSAKSKYEKSQKYREVNFMVDYLIQLGEDYMYNARFADETPEENKRIRRAALIGAAASIPIGIGAGLLTKGKVKRMIANPNTRTKDILSTVPKSEHSLIPGEVGKTVGVGAGALSTIPGAGIGSAIVRRKIKREKERQALR